MRERLVELLKQDPCPEVHCDSNCRYAHLESCYADRIADYLIANGVIVPPCKVGDIVYQTDGVRIYELTILDISLYKNKPYYETDEIDFDNDAIGESIFLTKEEAISKLQEVQSE